MRPIDADELKRLRDDYIQGKLVFQGDEYDMIDMCPTINIEYMPLVRCGECEYRHTRPFCSGRRADWFCADGKRRINNGTY